MQAPTAASNWRQSLAGDGVASLPAFLSRPFDATGHRGKLYVSAGMRVQPQTRLRIADNSGAVEVMCLPKSYRGRTARVGSMITVSVKKARPESKAGKGTVQR